MTGTVQAQLTPPILTKSRVLQWIGAPMRFAGLAIDRETDLVKLRAAFVFFIRVAGAALAFGSQALLARWMGTSGRGCCCSAAASIWD